MCSDQVSVLGKIVDISPAAINAFYSLPDIAKDRFFGIIRTNPSLLEISQVLSGGGISLLPNWHKIQKEQLTQEAMS